jgi:hypothetical protein
MPRWHHLLSLNNIDAPRFTSTSEHCSDYSHAFAELFWTNEKDLADRQQAHPRMHEFIGLIFEEFPVLPQILSFSYLHLMAMLWLQIKIRYVS